MNERYFICVSGVVQGVGFRPFVYQLAVQHHLTGWVMNSSEGVKIDVQGHKEALDLFVRALRERSPRLARVDDVICARQRLGRIQGFTIHPSQRDKQVAVSVSPDQSICPECLSEMYDQHSPYYHYPFINCTHCGPRYSIIEQLPYDRGNTTMKGFDFCPSCLQAYQAPSNRRYHAQPTSCHHCGPKVALRHARGTLTTQHDQVFEQAAEILSQGGVIAVKGLGGFHLVCDATSSVSVSKLRQMKYRQRKPFAVMVDGVATAAQYVTGEPAEWQALKASAAPIVLMNRRPHPELVPEVACDRPYLGVMLPYTPLHHLLFEQYRRYRSEPVLVMTSGNLSGMPLVTDGDEMLRLFGEALDAVLDHDRPIANPCDDSIVHYAGNTIRVLRMARGYAPFSHHSDYQGAPIVAMGAQQKSTIAMALSGQSMLSPYIGDLDDLDTQQRYEKTISLFQHLYQCEPSHWVCDYHPGYFSTQSAHTRSGGILPVQHHHAHILAVMAEYQITDPVLGFAFDGTGMGDDDTVWGGEVLLADTQGYQRCGSLRPFRLIGGERAIREPARILLAMLLECYSLQEIRSLAHPAFQGWDDHDFSNLHQLWLSGQHSPLCSSVGRLFDAWACLGALLDRPDFDGESGLLVESAAMTAGQAEIPWEMNWADGTSLLDWKPLLIRCIESQIWLSQAAVSDACLGLIAALAGAIQQMAGRYPSLPVIVSGGVFQNRLLMDVLWQKQDEAQPIYSGTMIPVNDSGIAMGQLWYGIHQR
ncbi:Carbamoyltransferase HypF [Vibrio ruber DSM 16370]|uniref:Carbamoyltransferase HypF n=1 Tax=Vibrio ruber (strain DSM 16370 / JCM 11486 / BCRC 17186 / CECT 7878 / LMG 23124 / VR1) TaxID=1123498 RepID=A0A1R4LTI1_VIBR1|nr:carbamoyltransferase HypF [Vibrio ruber]SJN59594.1 Carbamoyltransferase HypF [Vibrio ruber DSM 16370]